MDIFIKFVTFVTCIYYASCQDCTQPFNQCNVKWKAAMAAAKKDVDMECSAVIVYAACLKGIEAQCSADEQAAIDKVLNKNILPVLSNQCQAQSCDVEFASCTNAWKQATGQTLDVASKCKETEQYMTCLLNIESTCTPAQINSIRALLNQIGPKINQECKGEDCTVQSSMCIAVWNVSISDTIGNIELTCNANEAFDVCLRAIEAECSAAERSVINNLIGQINPLLYSKCKGYGCTPMLYECVTKFNNTKMTTSNRCSAYETYEQCLNQVQLLCNVDEKNTVQNDLKVIHPLIQQLCAGNGAVHVKPLIWSVIIYLVYWIF